MEKIKNRNILLIGSFLLALYWALALWDFWSVFIDALGFNLTLFILGMLMLFFFSTGINAMRKNYFWVMPIILIAISFSLWENPFLKVINILILPFILSIFFAYALSAKRHLNLRFTLLSIIGRISAILKIKETFLLIFQKIHLNEKNNQSKIIVKIILGLLLFLSLAFTIFIPLLASADPTFAELVKGVMDWFNKIISFRYLNRIIFVVISTIATISYFLSFNITTEDKIKDSANKQKPIDPIISGIILGGVMLLYLIFLFTQFSHLWIETLPSNFYETERLVKGGFWQLFMLSIINIIFFFGYFRNTNNIVQNILKAFTITSFFLLVSAGYRMFLYVFYYGLSYEKFFASYAVTYFALIFIWLAYKLFINRPANLFKFLIFSLLWMYSVLTVLPIERIIFSTNDKLSKRSDSRINMNELQMLSYDALPLSAAKATDPKWQSDWCYWGRNKTEAIGNKKWYTKNLSAYSSVKIPEKWTTEDCRTEEQKLVDDASENLIEPIEIEPITDNRKIYNNKDFSFDIYYPEENWRIINYFDMEENKNKGTYVYKDGGNNIFIMPQEDTRKVYSDKGAIFSNIIIDKFSGKKRVWKTKEGTYFMTIRLSSFPSSWEKNHWIEAKYTQENQLEIEKIINSLIFF